MTQETLEKENNNNVTTTNPFVHPPPTMAESAPEGPSVPQIEVRVLTQEEQQAQFNSNINTRKNYINWYFRCRTMAICNVVIFTFLGFVALLYAIAKENANLFGYAVVIIFYMFTSFLLLYRFPRTVNRERDIRESRESKASMLMSCSLIVIGVILFIFGIDRLASGTPPITDDSSILVSTLVVIASVFSGVILTWAATVVDSFMVMKAAVLSFSVSVISFFISLTALVYYYAEAMWWLDSLVELFIGVFFISYSAKTLLSHGPQIRMWLCPPTLPTKASPLSDLDKQWMPQQAPINNQA